MSRRRLVPDRSPVLMAAALPAVLIILLLAVARATPAAAAVYDETPVVSPQTAAGDNFGTAVALDAETLVVGAQWASPGGREKAGAAVVFRRASGGWVQVRRLTADDGQPFDQFGAAVALDGDLLAVGANLADVGGSTNQGAVYLFERNAGGPDNWGQVRKLTIPAGGGNFDNFGAGLAVQGDELFVGAPDADAFGSNRRGAVYVFRRGDGWDNPATLTDPESRESDNFGAALAVDGDWLLIGSARADVTGPFENDGAALLFRRAGAGAPWAFERRLVAGDPQGSSRFGAAVALRGGRALVGAPAVNRGSDFTTGAAYLFERDRGGAGNWGQAARLSDPDGRTLDSFGIRVALADGVAFAAAYQADVALADEGAVFVFEPGGGGWTAAGRISASDGVTNDGFGLALAQAGDTLVVGAPLAGVGAGKVYAYTPGAPPQRSFTYLPLTFNPSFVPSGQLTDGGVVITPEGVRLGAPAGSLDGPLPVSLRPVPEPPEPLGLGATPRGAYYRLAAAQEMAQPLDEAFILALPIPPGANRERLAVATLAPTDRLVHPGPPDVLYWSLTPGVVDEANDLLLAVWPYLSAAGETVVLVEHPDMVSPPSGATSRSMTAATGETANFVTICAADKVCKASTLQAYAEALQRNYVDFFINFSFQAPRLQKPSSDLSIDPPDLGNPVDKYWTFMFDPSKPACETFEPGTVKLGAYRKDTGALFICLSPTGDLNDEMQATIRHELFHAFQYAYSAVLQDAVSREHEDWILEGTAVAVERSGEEWERTTDFKLRAVDKGLRFVETGVLWPYMAQDFWVYHGKTKLPIGIDWFKQLFARGATQDDVAAAMDFDEVYAEFIRNQVIDHNERFDEALLPKCKLQEDLITAMETFPVDTTGKPARIGITRMLNSTIVELDFQEDWHGKPANIYVNMLPEGTPQPDWFHWKVYRLPYPDCASFPANVPQEYEEISPNLRYFVVISNGEDVKDQGWIIELE